MEDSLDQFPKHNEPRSTSSTLDLPRVPISCGVNNMLGPETDATPSSRFPVIQVVHDRPHVLRQLSIGSELQHLVHARPVIAYMWMGWSLCPDMCPLLPLAQLTIETQVIR